MALATDSLDLNLLPKPGVIEELDYEAILARQRQKFMDVWREVKLANPDAVLPDYDVQLLETDPAMVGNEAETYRETNLRDRINQAARANLLAFAMDGDLDHLAAFYDVTRMDREDDERLVKRVILAIQGRSTGGVEPRYKFIVMSADIRVQDAKVYTVGRSPLIRVAVFSTAPDGVATPDLLAIVDAAVQDPARRMVNDTIVVASAVQQVANLVADIWLLPDADIATVERAEANLRANWTKVRALGRDLTESWWRAQLMIAGVHKVTTTMDDVVALPSEAIAIGTVTLNNRGRAF